MKVSVLALASFIMSFTYGNMLVDGEAPPDDRITCTIQKMMTKKDGNLYSNHVCVQKNGIMINLNNADDFINDEDVQTITVKRSALVGGKFDASLDLSNYEDSDYKIARSLRNDTPTMGDFTAVVVVVEGSDGVRPVDSAQDYAVQTFTDPDSNMAHQFLECSGGRTKILPGTGPNLENGAIQLVLSEPLGGVVIGVAENMAIDALAEEGIVPNNCLGSCTSSQITTGYDFIMLFMPSEPGGVIETDGRPFGGAHAMMPGWLSVYNEGAGRQTAFQQHEIGHNFNQAHSMRGTREYGDNTCMMGGDAFGDELVCFNGAKSWWLGYYEDRHIEITPTTRNADIIMVSPNDYNNGDVNANGQYTVARISGDVTTPLYIIYNRAEGPNIDTYFPDEIVVVKQKDERRGWAQNSKLVTWMDVGGEYIQANWDDSDKSLIIRVCDKVYGVPDYARVQVYLEGDDLSCNASPITVPPPPPTSAPSPVPLSQYEEITSETCETYGLETITSDDECVTAAESVGINYGRGVKRGEYSDILDGCSVRYRDYRKSDLYNNPIGLCDPNSSSSYSTNCKCDSAQVCLCRRDLQSLPTKSPSVSALPSPPPIDSNPTVIDGRPNIIVMQPDDMAFFDEWTPPPNNPTRPNKYNYFPVTNGMPHMDSLRLNGAQMMEAYTASPACGTSRYSTITGKYPSRAASSRDDNVEGIAEVTIPKTKLMDVGDEKDCTRDNIAVALRDAGYRTGMVGKWHLSRINDSDYSYTHAVDIVKGCGFDFVDALYIENMEADPDDFDNYSDGTFSHNMEFVTHEAVKFIKEGDGPFFLYVNPTVPHASQAVDVALNNFTCQDTPRGTDTSDFMIPGMTEEFGSCEAYRANVTARADTAEDLGSIWLDDSVGAILQALNDKDILDNTMIIFQQDHGVETKMALYENGNRIAQFVHYPDVIQPGTKYYIPVSTIDIAATLLDFAEVEESPYHMDGKSWKNDILESENDYNRCLFFEMEKDRAVRCGCDKYLTIYEQDTGTSTTYLRGIRYELSANLTNLFDLCGDTDSYITDSGDNQESKDLNLVDDFPEIAEDMTKVLQCHLDRTSHSADPGNITRCDLNVITSPPTPVALTDSPTTGPITDSPTLTGCKPLIIELVTDAYGSETSWEVKRPDGEIELQGGGYDDITDGEDFVYDYCLVPQCDYTFTIFDDYGDGMCCEYGIGSYRVTFDGEIIASGNNFDYEESTNFGCDLNIITSSPSSEPLTNSPTSTYCRPLRIEINTDAYGAETSWEVEDSEGIIISQGNGYASVTDGETFVYDYCLAPQCDYTFTIFDAYGDGICCEYGVGSYTVTYDGEVVASGNNFEYEESTNFGCICEDGLLPIAYGGTGLSCAMLVSADVCYVEFAQSHCPLSCNACPEFGCEDSQAPLSVNGNVIYCAQIKTFLSDEELEEKCEELEILAFTCRATCKICG